MSKALVAYFSATGTTGVIATKLAETINADCYEIVPADLYTNADLDWRDENSRSSIEMKKEPNCRPVIGSAPVDNMDQYDVIFVGYPVWWYICPKIINTFLENYNLSGKTIVLFATSGGSGFGKSVESLEDSAPNARIVEGAVLNGVKSAEELKAFAKKYL
ncbi:MAG: NAD(P)H-dependent oxidoreductase [Eubacterium sp.]|nr:NAD(P)H-dependent oxidoreductase [Eubacterium sp.]